MIVSSNKKFVEALNHFTTFSNLKSKRKRLNLIGWIISNAIIVLKIEIRIFSTSRPRNNSFCQKLKIQTINVYRTWYSQFEQTIVNFWRFSRTIFGGKRRRWLFIFHKTWDSPNLIRRLLESLDVQQIKFAFKLFRFCDIKTQQRYNLKEENSISRREIVVLLDNLCDFLKVCEQVSKSPQILLSRHKFEIGSTLSKDDLLLNDIKIFEIITTSVNVYLFVLNKQQVYLFHQKKSPFQLRVAEILNINHHDYYSL